MALSVKKGSFNAEIATGNKAYTGIGFQPKALILWATAQTAAGFQNVATFGIGFATDSTHRKTTRGGIDNGLVGGSNSGMGSNDLILEVPTNGNQTIGIGVDIVSMDADGFTLNYTVAGAGKNYVIHYLALGGADLTNVFVGTTSLAAGATSAITGVGFKPDCVLYTMTGSTTHPLALGSHDRSDLGFAVSASQQGLSTMRDNSSATPVTDSKSYQRSVRCAGTLTTNASTLQNEFDLATMDADGFTLNTPTKLTNVQLHYLCLKGGSYWVGADTQKTSTGTQAKTGVGFQPKGVLFASVGKAASTAVQADAKLTIGATDGSTDGCVWNGATDAAGTSAAACATVTTKCLRHAVAPSTTSAEANIQTLDADGYTLNWTTADATAREHLALAFGNTPVSAVPRPVVVKQAVHRAASF